MNSIIHNRTSVMTSQNTEKTEQLLFKDHHVICYLACRPSAYHVGRDQVGIVDVLQSDATPVKGGLIEGGVTRGCLAHCVGHDGHFDFLKDRGRDTRCTRISRTPTWVWRYCDL